MASVVYFVQAGEDGPIKIGTTGSLKRRIETMQTASPVRLRLLGTIEAGRSYESELHRRFSVHAMHGEWFAATADLLSFIATSATPYVEPPSPSQTALDRYLTGRSLTDAEFAAVLNDTAARCKASGGWIRQIRNGTKSPSAKLARRIVEVTAGAVPFDSLIDTGSKQRAA